MVLPAPWFRVAWLITALGSSVCGALGAAPADLPAKIDALFARWEKSDAPGVIVGVSRAGSSLHARGYGMANLEHGVALTPDTLSESGSVAKQFTAAAVALLAVRSQLSLEDSVRKYLPALPPFTDGITVRMLLNHTNGLRDIHGLFDLLGRPSYTSMHSNDEVVRVVARQRGLNFQPGAEYVYCNTGYVLAAQIVERVANTSFNAFCIEHVFRPRGMVHTRWRDDFAAIVPGRAAGYAPRAAGGFRLDTPVSNLVGNGGLLTTVGDLLAWTASFDHATGEWARVVELLQTPSTLANGTQLTYGLGLSVGSRPELPEISHGGSTSGYRTYLTRFPSHQLAIAVLSNRADFNAQASARSIARVILDLPADPRPARVAMSPTELETCAGLYHSEQTDALLSFSVRSGNLVHNALALTPIGSQTFTTASGQMSFRFSTSGSNDRSVVVTSENATTTFKAKARAKPSAAGLSAYAATYYSGELNVDVVVAPRNGRLTLTRWPQNSITGEPTFADGFWFGRDWHVTFLRSADGTVTSAAFTNSSGRCRRIAFVRR